jgi:hypothetical protein
MVGRHPLVQVDRRQKLRLSLRFSTHGSLTFLPRQHSNFLGVFQQTVRGHHERAGWSWADAMRAMERNADAEKAGPEAEVRPPIRAGLAMALRVGTETARRCFPIERSERAKGEL